MDRCVSGHFRPTESLYPLDFTSPPKHSLPPPEQELPSPESEPVLDLSCKKYIQNHHSSPSHSPSTYDNSNVAPFTDANRKSPFERARSYMVTPPSESDSPKKIKYEPIYNQINSTTSDLSLPLYPVLPLPAPGSPGAPPLPLAQSVVVAQNSSQTLSGSVQHVATPTQSPDPTKKIPRPFKAYPKDPLSLTMGSAELIYDQNSNEAYSEFRKRMLDSVKKTNEGTNVKMRRTTKSPNLPTSTMDDKDAAYWERRRKNNEAAKRSRDARRAKEDEIAIRAAFLEQENIKLKYELVALRNETAKLRCMVYSS